MSMQGTALRKLMWRVGCNNSLFIIPVIKLMTIDINRSQPIITKKWIDIGDPQTINDACFVIIRLTSDFQY